MKATQERLNNMGFLDTIEVTIKNHLYADITRVTGGWIYQYRKTEAASLSTTREIQIFNPVFVPDRAGLTDKEAGG